MAVEYVGKTPPLSFSLQYPKSVVNGSLATGNTFRTIGNNQAWLATQDVPAINYYTDPSLGWDHTVTKYIFTPVRLPPFCQFIEVALWISRDFDQGAVNNPLITIESPTTTRRINLLGGGSDQSGKTPGVVHEPDENMWVFFAGEDPGDLTAPEDQATALPMLANRGSAWVNSSFITYTSSSTIRIHSAYYRVVPFRGRLASWGY